MVGGPVFWWVTHGSAGLRAAPPAETVVGMVTDYSNVYVERPDIPAGMTISGYRQSRPRRVAWWRRLVSASSQA